MKSVLSSVVVLIWVCSSFAYFAIFIATYPSCSYDLSENSEEKSSASLKCFLTGRTILEIESRFSLSFWRDNWFGKQKNFYDEEVCALQFLWKSGSQRLPDCEFQLPERGQAPSCCWNRISPQTFFFSLLHCMKSTGTSTFSGISVSFKDNLLEGIGTHVLSTFSVSSQSGDKRQMLIITFQRCFMSSATGRTNDELSTNSFSILSTHLSDFDLYPKHSITTSSAAEWLPYSITLSGLKRGPS